MTEIKPALEQHAQTLADLGARTFIETFSADNTKEDVDLYVARTFRAEKQLHEIRDPDRRIEIAWVNGQAAGFLHLRKGKPDPSVTSKNAIEILRLYVDSRWHGHGIGPQLMERSLEIARTEGFTTVWLGVWENNFRALAFYRKFGFTKVGQHVFHLGNDPQTDLILERQV